MHFYLSFLIAIIIVIGVKLVSGLLNVAFSSYSYNYEKFFIR